MTIPLKTQRTIVPKHSTLQFTSIVSQIEQEIQTVEELGAGKPVVSTLLCRNGGRTFRSWTLPRQLPTTLALGLALVSFAWLALFFFLVKLGQVQSERATGICSHILADTDKRLAALIKHVLETNDNALKVHFASLLNIVAYFSQVDCQVEWKIDMAL